MMAAHRGVVVTEVEYLQQKKPKAQGLRAAVLAYAAHPSPETVLVLVQSPGTDADAGLSRAVDSVEFGPLPPHRLEGWVRREAGKVGLTLEDGAIAHLQATVGDDLSALAAELRKLGAAVSDRPATIDDVADLVGVRHGETLHDFVDAVTGRRAVEAAAMVPRLLDGPGVTPVRLLGAVGTALVGVGLARALLDDGVRPGSVPGRIVQALRAARPWGLRDWDDEAAAWTRDAGAWTLAELDAALGELLRADRRVKNTKVATGGDILREAVLATATGVV
jgi:DNA polymerase III delta subunit